MLSDSEAAVVEDRSSWEEAQLGTQRFAVVMEGPLIANQPWASGVTRMLALLSANGSV